MRHLLSAIRGRILWSDVMADASFVERACEHTVVVVSWRQRKPGDLPSNIFPQPYDPTPNALLFRHGEIFICSVERVKNGLPANFFELSYEPHHASVALVLDYHIMTGLNRKIRIYENDLILTEERLHRIALHLHGKGTLPWNVCFEQRFSVHEARRLFACDHLVNLIPPQ